MDDNINEQVRLHSAGAAVRHTSPFHNLSSHRNSHDLTQEFLDQWVYPYMSIGDKQNSDWAEVFVLKSEVSKEVVLALLGDFDWRTRSVGTYFAAVKGYSDLTDVIGVHLLKSEVCYVGHMYALVLAYFNTKDSINYLNKYLEYYLKKPELYFDQLDVMMAVKYLDRKNNTDDSSRHEKNWNEFQESRLKLETAKANAIAQTIKKPRDKQELAAYMKQVHLRFTCKIEEIETEDFEGQIKIISELS